MRVLAEMFKILPKAMTAVLLYIVLLLCLLCGCQSTGKQDVTVKPDQRLDQAFERISAIENRLSKSDEAAGKLQGQVDAAANAVVTTKSELNNKIDQSVSTLTNSITSIDNKVIQVQNTITNAENKATSAQNGAAAAQEYATKVEKNLGTMIQDIKNESTTANNSAALATKEVNATKDNLASLKTNLGSLEQKWSSVQTSVTRNEQYTWKIFWTVIIIVVITVAVIVGLVIYFTWWIIRPKTAMNGAMIAGIEQFSNINAEAGKILKSTIQTIASGIGVEKTLNAEVTKRTNGGATERA